MRRVTLRLPRTPVQRCDGTIRTLQPRRRPLRFRPQRIPHSAETRKHLRFAETEIRELEAAVVAGGEAQRPVPGAPLRGKSSSARGGGGGGGVRTAAAEELSSKRLRRDELEAMLEEARGIAEARMHSSTLEYP